MKQVTWLIGKIIMVILFFVAGAISYSAFAASITTQVTVANTAPTFSAGPFEDPASFSSVPTNTGNTVTFKATGTDSNNDPYRLAICKSNAITPNGTGNPTCDGGLWCVSGSTVSGVESNCSYTALTGDSESNDWYAFLCDSVSGSTCSVMSQGVSDSGSPFSINHAPTFTVMASSAAAPGDLITFTATASDADIENITDTVVLVVCSVAGATADGCTVPANQLCKSVPAASNPTCGYTLPAVHVSGSTPYYSYIYDSHNMGASNNPFPSKSYTVTNVAPTVSNIVVNGATDIILTAGSTTNIIVTGTITDANSCQNISTVKTSVYRSGIGYSACDTVGELNYNYCYSQVACTVSVGTCANATDSSADYSCTVAMQYHSDATDVVTLYSAENWLGTMLVTDAGALTGTAESSTPVEVASLTAFGVDASIAYGNIGLGQDSGSTNITNTITALGNVGVDIDASGTDMTNGTDSIPVANQKYSLGAFTYQLGGSLLSLTPTEIELNVQKTINAGTPGSKILYWGIAIPSGISTGTYSGTNYITAVKGETIDW